MSIKKKSKSPISSDARSTRKGKLRFLIPLIIIAVVGVGGYMYWQKNEVPDVSSHKTEKTLVAKKGRLELLPSEKTGIDFQNTIIETAENNITTNINIYNGGGVAIADVNKDGKPDIYFVASNGPNRLYINEGDFRFKDITESAGLLSEEGFETAVTAVDINADGWLDFYVCRGGPEATEDRRNKLFINNGNLTFTERSSEYGLDDISASTGANFFDSDNDGDLDLYLLNYPTDLSLASKIDVQPGPDGRPVPNMYPKKPYDTDRFYRNDGNKFTDISREAGIWNIGFGLSVSVTDFNRDGYVDVYVGNDFIHPDKLYINNQNNTFTDRLSESFQHCTMATMGTELADFDNDGLIDLFAVEMLPAKNYRNKTLQTAITVSKYQSMVQNGYFEPVIHNVLQRNNGNGTFSDIACQAGVFKTDWSWSGLLSDLDNDGFKDLYITNGYRREITNRDFFDFAMTNMLGPGNKSSVDEILAAVPTFKIRNFVFENSGNWQFEDKSGEWMTVPASWSCGAAYGDLDGDGDIDIVVNNLEDPAYIYENHSRESEDANFLVIELQGSTLNPYAVGASVLIEYQGVKQIQEMNPTRGIFSSVQHLLHFGLADVTAVDKVSVRWPDGKVQSFENVPANQKLVLKHTDATDYALSLVPNNTGDNLFRDITAESGVDFKHIENPYFDFEAFPLNPWKESALGPLLAKGDINGDGLQDFFIGSAFNSPSALYMQLPGGKFQLTSQRMWDLDKGLEDHGALFFDMEGDGDMDLFVVGGGAEAVPAGRNVVWQTRVYINTDGRGTMVRASQEVMPDIREVGLRLVSHDYDNDGDQDIFIGGRVKSDKWPLTPQSFVLRNERNRFTDVTAEVGGDFTLCGMVTDLAWANLYGDARKELIVVGEFMPVSVFQLHGGKLIDVTDKVGLSKSNGLWYRVAVADLDGDGDEDLVTGNLGNNTRFTASQKEPLRCFAKDFDNNGTIDPLLAYHEDGKLYPVMQKDAVLRQMPSLKKKFLYADKYGKATMSDLWPQKDLDESLNLYCYDLESCWWENQNGTFIRHALPVEAQSSSSQGILIDDFTGDGILDLMLAGNEYGLDVETGRCDAGIGVLLQGDGKGNFTWLNNIQTGFWARREVRDLAVMRSSEGKQIVIVANNNSAVQLFMR